MPHLVAYYSANIDQEPDADLDGVCKKLASEMIACQDEGGKPVFPTGGVRVLLYPAAHYAVADSSRDFAFMYWNLRMAKGRSAWVHKDVGERLCAVIKQHFEPLFTRRGAENRNIGITFQIDEGTEVFDMKHSNLHPLFQSKIS